MITNETTFQVVLSVIKTNELEQDLFYPIASASIGLKSDSTESATASVPAQEFLHYRSFVVGHSDIT